LGTSAGSGHGEHGGGDHPDEAAHGISLTMMDGRRRPRMTDAAVEWDT
jgi:hypothetical protein